MQLCNDVKSPIQFFPNIDVNYIFFLKCNINRHPKMQKYKKVAKYVHSGQKMGRNVINSIAKSKNKRILKFV